MQVQFFEVGTTAAESECSYDRAVVKVKDWRTAGPFEGDSSYCLYIHERRPAFKIRAHLEESLCKAPHKDRVSGSP